MWKKIKAFLLENQTASQTVAKNALWLGASNLASRFLRALIVIYAARVLGAADWGVFSYAITLIAFLTIFADFGINSLLTREAARREPAFRDRFMATSFLLKCGFSIAVMAAVIFLIPPFVSLKEAVPLLPIVALVLLFDNFRDFGFSLIRSAEQMEKEAGLFLFTNLAIVGFGFLFLRLSATVESFTWAYVAGSGLGMLLTFWTVRGYLGKMLLEFDRKLIRPILAGAWPFALSGILGGLMVNTDVLVIGSLRTATDVGYYSAAQRVILLLYVLPGVLATSIFPLLARLAASGDKDRARRLVESALRSVLLISLPIVIGGVILSEPLIRFLFGAEYVPGTLSLQILLLTVPMNFVAAILSNVVFAYDAQKKLVIYAGIGGVLNLILDLILIPFWGIAGSSFATLCVQIVSAVYLWNAAKRLQPFRVLHRLGKIILASAIMGAVLLLLLPLHLKVLFLVAASAAIYFLILYLIKEPLLQEILIIFGITSREV